MVEFSLVALPFLALIAVIVEAAFLVFAQHGLDVAVERTARLLRTGEFQDGADGNDPAERLRRLLCAVGYGPYNCDEIRLDVVNGASFSVDRIVPAYDADRRDWAEGFGTHFSCPPGGGIVALRVAVPVPRPFRFLDFTGQRMPDGKQLLTSTAVFRTEGYVQKSC